MYVCVLSDGFPPWERGGAQKIAAQLARGYRERGHRVSVLTTVTDRVDRGTSAVEGIDVHRVHSPKPRSTLPYLTVYNPFTVRPCRRLLATLSPDVVHAHNTHWLSNGVLEAASAQCPVVKTFHDAGTVAYGDFDAFVDRVPIGREPVPRESYAVSERQQLMEQKLRYNPLRRPSNRRTHERHVDVGVAVSDALRRGLEANGMPCEEVIHNGVDAAAWAGGDGGAFRRQFGLGDDRMILFGGRTSYEKGGEHLARAFARLSDETDETVTLVVTGDEGFVSTMRRVAGAAGDDIVATGWIDPDAYRDAMAAATVVASPSVFLDPFPTVNLEAFAAGTPVVTSRFGGARELVDHGKDGYVVDPRDVGSLADALGRLVESPNRASTFGRRGREKVVSDFQFEERIDAYLDLLRAAAPGSGHVPVESERASVRTP